MTRFRDRYVGADLEKGRTSGQVADATRHDHQELWDVFGVQFFGGFMRQGPFCNAPVVSHPGAG